MSDVDHSVKLSVRMSDWILDKELDGEGKETIEILLRGIRDEVVVLETHLDFFKSLIGQMDFFDEDERNNITSALETAKEIGVFLDDLEESIANVNRLFEIKQMLETRIYGIEGKGASK